MRRFFAVVLLAFCVLPVVAQDTQPVSYTQPGEFAVDYPAGWQVEADDASGFVYLRQGDVQLTFYSPEVLAAYHLGDYNPETLVKLIASLNAVETLESGSLPDDERQSYFVRYRSDANSTVGLLMARTFDDRAMGLVDGFGPAAAVEAQESAIFRIVATFDRPPIPVPTLLANAAAAWPQAINELESGGLIPSGGELVFADAYVYATGVNLTQPLASWLDLADVVVAGRLQYTASANPADDSCGMLARLDGSGGLEIGFDSGGQLYVIDAGEKTILGTDLDVSVPQHMLFVVVGPRLLVYFDGALITDQAVADGSGSFGVRVQGSGSSATCAVSDMWAYRVPAGEPGVCEITASGGAVNRRTGPGAGFDIAGILEDGATATATAQFTAPDGLTWWQLADSTWVREDVVTEQGACRALPSGG